MFNESCFNCFDGDIISVQGFLSQSDFTTPSSDPGPPGGGTVGPPSATETSPTDGATDIVLNAVVTLTFNREIDPASVTKKRWCSHYGKKGKLIPFIYSTAAAHDTHIPREYLSCIF
jgi:hypothetical protein